MHHEPQHQMVKQQVQSHQNLLWMVAQKQPTRQSITHQKVHICYATQHNMQGILLVFVSFLLSKHLQRPFSHPKAFSTTTRAWLRQ